MVDPDLPTLLVSVEDPVCVGSGADNAKPERAKDRTEKGKPKWLASTIEEVGLTRTGPRAETAGSMWPELCKEGGESKAVRSEAGTVKPR